MTKPTQPTSRRNFLKGTTAVTAGAALASTFSAARMAHAAGPEIIKVALIGAGGRGKGAANDCLNADPSIRLVAIADAFEDAADRAAKALKTIHNDRVDLGERIFSGLDAYQKAIDSGVDMVLLAEPPGFRPYSFAAAVKAGKHVFMEKPCCVDAPGYRKLVEACKLADEKNLKVGVGLQRRHGGYHKGVKAIQDGRYGDILFLRAYWNGSGIWLRERKPGMSELQFQVHNWYHFTWLSGDNICEQHVHNLDICNWIMNDHPIEANGMGGCQVRQRRDASQIFDHHFVEFTYKNGVKMYSQCRHQPGTWSSVSEWVHGTKGSGKVTGSAVGYVQEHVDLIKAIRDNAKYNEAWYGATSSMTAVMGRMATYSGKAITWEDAVAAKATDFPSILAWEAEPKVKPDAQGLYPMAIPGAYNPYEG
jgi:predicted dehydrogenase